MDKLAEAHSSHRSCNCHYREGRKQQADPFIFAISGYSANW
jgi:hypothetical protein